MFRLNNATAQRVLSVCEHNFGSYYDDKKESAEKHFANFRKSLFNNFVRNDLICISDLTGSKPFLTYCRGRVVPFDEVLFWKEYRKLAE